MEVVVADAKQAEEYKDDDFITYKKYKQDEFMENYSKEFARYGDFMNNNNNRPFFGYRRMNMGRVSRAFRQPTREERIGRYRVFTDFEREEGVKKKMKERSEEEEEEGEEVEKVYDCSICWETSEEKRSPMVHLECNHSFHSECLEEWIARGPQKGEQFTTSHHKCPMCRSWCFSFNNRELNLKIRKIEKKTFNLRKILLQSIMNHDGEELKHYTTVKENKNESKIQDVLDKYVFYTCYDCEDIYFGGRKDCVRDLQQQQLEEEEIEGEEEENEKKKKKEEEEEDERKERVCTSCFDSKSKNFPNECAVHGKDYIAYKCRFCCSLSNYFCFGTTHFCERCHQQAGSNKVYECPGLPECDGRHVPNGTEVENEQCLGCVMCRKFGDVKIMDPKMLKPLEEKDVPHLQKDYGQRRRIVRRRRQNNNNNNNQNIENEEENEEERRRRRVEERMVRRRRAFEVRLEQNRRMRGERRLKKNEPKAPVQFVDGNKFLKYLKVKEEEEKEKEIPAFENLIKDVKKKKKKIKKRKKKKKIERGRILMGKKMFFFFLTFFVLFLCVCVLKLL